MYLWRARRAKEVLRDLKSVVKSTDAAESYAMGFGLGFRVMGVKAGMSVCCFVTLFFCLNHVMPYHMWIQYNLLSNNLHLQFLSFDRVSAS